MHSARIYRRAAILLALVSALAAIASSSAVHETLVDALSVTDEIIGRHAVTGAAVFILLAAVSAMFAFVSIAVIVPAAVFAWGTSVTVGLLWVGWILGGMATYCAGRLLGRPLVQWLAAGESLRRLESRLPEDAPLWLIVLLQLAVPSEIPGYVLGLLRYPIACYAIALALAELPYALATVHLGASVIEGRGGSILSVGVLIALFSVGAFYALSRALGRGRPATHV